MGLSHLLFLPRDARAVFAIWQCLFVRLSQLGLLLQHPFNGLFSRTTSVSRYQKGKTSLDLNGARDDGVLECRPANSVGVLSKRTHGLSCFCAQMLPSTYPTLRCKETGVSTKLTVLPSATLSQALRLSTVDHRKLITSGAHFCIQRIDLLVQREKQTQRVARVHQQQLRRVLRLALLQTRHN